MSRRAITLIGAVAAVVVIIGVLVVVAIAASRGNTNNSPNTAALPSATGSADGASPVPVGSPAAIGQRTKSEGCVINGPLQDRACTPGAILPEATKEKICVPGYAKAVRNVPEAEKNQVYAEYGISSRKPGQYEVDHLISLELGGSNDIANLWPEAAEPRPGFHEKDRYENFAHSQVCKGEITLQEAQRRIATDWLAYWNEAGKP